MLLALAGVVPFHKSPIPEISGRHPMWFQKLVEDLVWADLPLCIRYQSTSEMMHFVSKD